MERVNALEILREAMELEKDGIKFYSKTAKSCKDADIESVFKQLAEDELNHLEKLELLYDSLAENNEWLVMQDMMDEGSRKLEDTDLFEEDFECEDVSELEAIDRGIKAEKDSIEFYRKALTECRVEAEKGCELFKWLGDFERGHLRLLKEHRKALVSKKPVKET